MSTTPHRFTLNDAESKAVGRDHGFVAVIEWFNGSRGGRFRPMRTTALPTADEARRNADRIVASRRADAREISVYRVNGNGRVLETI